jgi:hypothetical protein
MSSLFYFILFFIKDRASHGRAACLLTYPVISTRYLSGIMGKRSKKDACAGILSSEMAHGSSVL